MADKLVKEDAEKLWAEIKTRHQIFKPPVPDFSPESLWIIENLFKSDEERRPGYILFFEKEPKSSDPKWRFTIFRLGAYIGEVVRRFYAGKCEWAGVDEYEIELRLPGENPRSVFPMKFIAEQITSYKPDSIVEWGRAAGLKIGDRPKQHKAHFRDWTG